MAESETRRCLECEQVLPLPNFRKNHKMAGGYTNRCKPCLRAKDVARFEAMSPEAQEEFKGANRESANRWREANPETVKRNKARHYQLTKERSKAKCYEWRKRNPERLRHLSRGWCAKRYRGIKDGLTAAQLADWADSQKKVCHWCGVRCADRYHFDHIIPLARGGKHLAANLCISCPPCNLRKNSRDPIEFAQSMGKLL